MGFAAIAALVTLAGQGQTMTGQVIKPDGSPAPGATVRIYRESANGALPPTETVADANGRFQIPADLPDPMAAPTYLVAEFPGFALGFASTMPPPKKLTLELGKPVRSTVRFVGPEGAPAAGLEVAPRLLLRSKGAMVKWLTLPDSLQKRFAVRTDAQGRATFENLPEGYQCEARVFDERFAQLSHQERFELGAAAAVGNPTVRLRKGAYVLGRVVLEGRPVPGVAVFAQASRTGGYGTTTTDAEGRFRLSQLGAGAYCVALNLPKDLGEDYAARAFEFGLKEGETKDDLTFKLETGGIVTGRVLRPDGKPAERVPVGVYGPARPRSGAAVQSVMTDAKGEYRLRTPSGEQFVYVQLNGGTTQTLTVKDGETAQADFQLARNAEPMILRGTVLDPSGKPVPGAAVFVQATERYGVRMETETDEEGRFEMPVSGDPSGFEIEVRKGDLYAASVVPETDGDTEIRTVRGGLATLSGVVRNGQGQAVPGAQVYLLRWQNGAGRSVAEERTDAQGRYRFPGQLPSREYSIYATAQGYGRKSSMGHLTPAKGESQTFPVLALIKADQSLMGRVVDENGKPMAGVQVSSQADERETVTDAEGKFKLTGLPKGQIPVLARKGDIYLTRSYETGRVEYELVLKRSDGSATSRADLTPVAVGQPAPEIEAKDWLNGSETSLKALRGRIVVLDFWAIWCGPCREELPKVRAMAERFKGQRVAVIGMHDASTWPKELKAFAAKNKMTYLLGIDKKVDQFGFGKTADRYGVNGIPTVVVIDRDGKVASVSNDAETARATVERLLKR